MQVVGGWVPLPPSSAWRGDHGVGDGVGDGVGAGVGTGCVGAGDGAGVGATVGLNDGLTDGPKVGRTLGLIDGVLVGWGKVGAMPNTSLCTSHSVPTESPLSPVSALS